MASPGILAAASLKSTFLEGIGASDLRAILATARPQQLAANSVVLDQSNPAQYLYLLTKGRARHFFVTEGGRKVLLKWLLPGEIFGGRALLSKPTSYLVSVETVEDSHALVWEGSVVRRLASGCPRLLENALFTASDYLAWYVATHVALTSHSARRRLADIVICLAELIGQRVGDGFEFDATNEELASAANITPFTASRLLSEWQQDRSVLKRRGKILLRSPEKLFPHTL
jgi:CRP-like cAMP-binding protein